MKTCKQQYYFTEICEQKKTFFFLYFSLGKTEENCSGMEYAVGKGTIYTLTWHFWSVFSRFRQKSMLKESHTHTHTHSKCDRCAFLAPHLDASVDPIYPVLWFNLVGFIVSLLIKRLGILTGKWDPQMEGGDLTRDLLTFVVELCGHVNLTVGVEESLEERNSAITDIVEVNYTVCKYVQVQCMIHLPLFRLCSQSQFFS